MRYFVQGRNAHQHLGARFLIQQGQDGGGLLRLEVRQHDGGDLRMLAADDLRDCLCFHPLQRLDALPGLPGRHTIEEQVRFLLPHRLGEHAPHEVLRAAGDICLGVGDADELVEHSRHLFARHLFELGHREAQFLDLAGVELL